MSIADYEKLFEKSYPFWENLTEREKELFCRNSYIKTFKKGSSINRTEQCAGFVLIKSGHLRIYILSEEGRDVTLFRLGAGSICIFTAKCVLDSISFDVLIETEEDSELIVLNPSVFHSVAQSNVYLKCFGYELAAQRMSEAMWTLQQVLFMRADKRLALVLWEEMEKNKSESIKLTHEQIAKYMGSAREVVSRLLKYLADEEIVELSRGTVKVTDKEKLNKIKNQ